MEIPFLLVDFRIEHMSFDDIELQIKPTFPIVYRLFGYYHMTTE